MAPTLALHSHHSESVLQPPAECEPSLSHDQKRTAPSKPLCRAVEELADQLEVLLLAAMEGGIADDQIEPGAPGKGRPGISQMDTDTW